MNAKQCICPYRLVGRCNDQRIYEGCEHATFHEPELAHGVFCTSRSGTCMRTQWIVECMYVEDVRRKQLQKYTDLQ
jgi:hypothetical protein